MTLSDADIWDPNTWDFSEPRYYILATPRLSHAFRVDYIDYIYFSQWLWDIKFPKRQAHRKKMAYCCRSTRDFTLDPPLNRSLYLHIEIMNRMGIPMPTPEHRLVDHIDGNTFNCTRDNLQRATYEMNRVRGDKR